MKFGINEWSRFFGKIGQLPPLTSAIDTILNSPCPFWSNKSVGETHILMFVPDRLNGRKYNLNRLSKIIQTPLSGKGTCFTSYDKYVRREQGHRSSLAHWLLMTYDVVPESRGLRFEKQKELLHIINSTKGLSYRLPTVLEAATCLTGAYMESNAMLLSDDPWTYTRCQELVNQGQWPVSVGGFSRNGFYIHDCRFASAHEYIGVTAVRELQ